MQDFALRDVGSEAVFPRPHRRIFIAQSRENPERQRVADDSTGDELARDFVERRTRLNHELLRRLRMRALPGDRIPTERARNGGGDDDGCDRGSQTREEAHAPGSLARRARNDSRISAAAMRSTIVRRFRRETSAAMRLFVAWAVVRRSSTR